MKRGAIPEGPEKPMAQAMDGEGEGWGRGRAGDGRCGTHVLADACFREELE